MNLEAGVDIDLNGDQSDENFNDVDEENENDMDAEDEMQNRGGGVDCDDKNEEENEEEENDKDEEEDEEMSRQEDENKEAETESTSQDAFGIKSADGNDHVDEHNEEEEASKKGEAAGVDNKGNVDLGGRTGHMETREYYLRELKEKSILVVKWKAGAENSSDMFTKNLARKKSTNMRQCMLGWMSIWCNSDMRGYIWTYHLGRVLEGIIRLVRMVQKIVIRTVYVLPIQMVSHM